MTRTLVVIAILSSVGCSDGQSSSQKDLARGKAKIERRSEMLEGVTILSGLCCDPSRASPEGPQACRALAPAIETSSEVYILIEATKCGTKVPVDALLGALQRRTLSSDPRAYIVAVLGEYTPTHEIVDALVRALDYPPTENGGVNPIGDYDKVIDSVVTVLAYLGEDDLAPVVAALSNSSAFVRDNAAHALWRASSVAPLDMPEAVAALRGLAGVERPVSGQVGLALSEIEASQRRTPAEEVAALADASESQRIRLLSRRRRFCGSTEATAELVRIQTSSPDGEIRSAATAAIAERAHRCGQINSK